VTGQLSENLRAREKICWKCGEKFGEDLETCPDDGSRLIHLSKEDIDDPMIGTLFDGRFRVLRKLGEGGMGHVYSARQIDFQRDVALKLLKADFLRDENIRRRFMYEARTISGLKHPNALRLYDFGQAPPHAFYMVMELLEGESLADRLAYRFLTYREVFTTVIPICGVLGEAHANDVVHRDLKPENIFLALVNEKQEFPKLLDFGIAKHLSDETMTKSGTLWGTPAYMSPEQAKGDKVNGLADVYAIGVILYELISGNLPFHASTQMGLAVKHISVPARPLSSIPGLRSVPEQLDDLIMRALSKDPASRPESMDALANELDQIVKSCFTDEVLDSVPAEEVDAIALQTWLAEEQAVEEDLSRESAATSNESLPIDTGESFARNTGNIQIPTLISRPITDSEQLFVRRPNAVRLAIIGVLAALLVSGGALLYATYLIPAVSWSQAESVTVAPEPAVLDLNPMTAAAGDAASRAAHTAYTARVIASTMKPKNRLIFVDAPEVVGGAKIIKKRRPTKAEKPSETPVKSAIESTF